MIGNIELEENEDGEEVAQTRIYEALNPKKLKEVVEAIDSRVNFLFAERYQTNEDDWRER
jgi:hypothetical protein